MPIVEDENPGDSGSILNLEKIKKLLSLYKYPLILAAIGLIFFLTGFLYIIRTQNTTSEVIFSTESSSSAVINKRKLHIDVEGAVMVPGVYTMEGVNIVADALVAAGGLSADADREWVAKNINRAAKLIDGGKIYIPSVTEITSGQTQNFQPKADRPLAESNLLGVTIGK